jgi:hypothetical protein
MRFLRSFRSDEATSYIWVSHWELMWHPQMGAMAMPSGREDDDDLYPRAEPGWEGVYSPIDRL